MRAVHSRNSVRAIKTAHGTDLRYPAKCCISLPGLASIALFCVFVAVASDTAAVSLPVQADAYIRSNTGVPGDPYSSTNYGSDPNVSVRGSYGNAPGVIDQASTLMKFDLSLLPNGTVGADVEKATLFIWVNGVSVGPYVNQHNVINVSPINANWLETGPVVKGVTTAVTFKNRPAVGVPFATVNVADVVANQYLAIDVTPQMRAWLNTPVRTMESSCSPISSAA